MKENNRIGRWELGCLVFNSLVFKLFSAYSGVYADFGGSASWLVALFSGAVFLFALWLILKLYERYADTGLLDAIKHKWGKAAAKAASAVIVIYFAISVCVALFCVCSALSETAFPRSPIWYTGLFIAIAAITTTLCGERAVRRMHSLSAFGVGFSIILISLLSFRYADIYNAAPILGKGGVSVFLKGLSSLFIYSDILIIFFMPRRGGEYSYKKTVMFSAALAVLINVLLMLAFSFNFPYEMADRIDLAAYSLTKGASAGKFPIRLDVAYMLSLIISAILYISLGLHIIVKSAAVAGVRVKRLGVIALSLILCLGLCGCYDSDEVEEKGYVIAIGIDKGEGDGYKYTFQISNPLESGGSIGAEEKAGENSQEEQGNKTVDNITVEAEDFYTAGNKLKSILSKETDLSHVKVVVLSEEIAKEGALPHMEKLLGEREVRPSANLCLVKSASDYLREVNPTLEESTVRYYELFFRNREVPYAPVTELLHFVVRSTEKPYDAVVPVADKDGLSGMGMFADGVLCGKAEPDEVLVYKLLCGELNYAGLGNQNSGGVISSNGAPKVKVDISGDAPKIHIEASVKAELEGDVGAVQDFLKRQAESFLYKTAVYGCDILGFGRYAKAEFTTQSEWEGFDWDNKYKKAVFSVNVITKNGK